MRPARLFVATLGGYASHQYNTGQISAEEYGDRLIGAGTTILGGKAVKARVRARFDAPKQTALKRSLPVLDEGPNYTRNGGCFAEDTLVLLPARFGGTDVAGKQTSGALQTGAVRTLSIATVALGTRVLGENPRPWDVNFEFDQPESETWVRIETEVRRTDGTVVEMEVLRPRE